MGTKNNPGAFDCYANAAPDEPMFVLLARDKHAPTLVWLWATLRELDGEDQAKVEEARHCVDSMFKWQLESGRTSIGLGHATLAGVFELIRTANFAARGATNQPTRDDVIRQYLGMTQFASNATENAMQAAVADPMSPGA